MRRFAAAFIMGMLICPSLQSRDDRARPDTPEQIEKKFAELTEHNRTIFGLRYWGDSIVAQVQRVKLISREKPKNQQGYVAGIAWPIVEPELYDFYTVDVTNRSMKKLVVPGLKQIVRLSMDGKAHVALGYDEGGGTVLRREKGDRWEDVSLPKEFLDAPLRTLVQSNTTLALMTTTTIHVWGQDGWRSARMPPLHNDSLNRPRKIEWAVTPNGRHFGKYYYVGWQETEFNGCLLALELQSSEPKWIDVNGVSDPAKGLSRSLMVAAVRESPKGQLWIVRDGEYVAEDVHRFDGKKWEKHWEGPSFHLLVDLAIGPNDECYLLSAKPPAQVLRVAGEKTDTILTIPGTAMSILADRNGNLLVGTTGYDIILGEKVGGGFQFHQIAP